MVQKITDCFERIKAQEQDTNKSLEQAQGTNRSVGQKQKTDKNLKSDGVKPSGGKKGPLQDKVVKVLFVLEPEKFKVDLEDVQTNIW